MPLAAGLFEFDDAFALVALAFKQADAVLHGLDAVGSIGRDNRLACRGLGRDFKLGVGRAQVCRQVGEIFHRKKSSVHAPFKPRFFSYFASFYTSKIMNDIIFVVEFSDDTIDE